MFKKLTLCWLLSLGGLATAEKPNVDALIVLATDTSDSVSQATFVLQRQGMAQALRDNQVRYALETCNSQGVGIAYFEWAGFFAKGIKPRIPWVHIQSGVDLLVLAAQIEGFNYRQAFGQTDIAGALKTSNYFFEQAPFTAQRRIINLSSDGQQNVNEKKNSGDLDFEAAWSAYLQRTRNALVNDGIVIDGIALDTFKVLSEEPLDKYFSENIVGGPGATLQVVTNINEFAHAFKRVLLRELDNCGF